MEKATIKEVGLAKTGKGRKGIKITVRTDSGVWARDWIDEKASEVEVSKWWIACGFAPQPWSAYASEQGWSLVGVEVFVQHEQGDYGAEVGNVFHLSYQPPVQQLPIQPQPQYQQPVQQGQGMPQTPPPQSQPVAPAPIVAPVAPAPPQGYQQPLAAPVPQPVPQPVQLAQPAQTAPVVPVAPATDPSQYPTAPADDDIPF